MLANQSLKPKHKHLDNLRHKKGNIIYKIF